jgi:hypothetical protein
MWEYLRGLPELFSFIIIILGLTAIVIISLKGTAAIRWGKNLIGLGGGAKNTDDPVEERPTHETGMEQPPSPAATAILRLPKRGCGDCILIIMSEREKYGLKMSNVHDKVLRNQMNFFEQKTVEIQELAEKIFCDLMESTKKQAAVTASGKNVDIEYKFFTELLKDALILVKNEIRKSYKENGYFEMSDSDFSIYLKDKNRLVINLIVQHVKSMYPSQGMTVTAYDFQSGLLFMMPQIHEILRECFVYAKEVTADSERQEVGYQREFSAWADKFISDM